MTEEFQRIPPPLLLVPDSDVIKEGDSIVVLINGVRYPFTPHEYTNNPDLVYYDIMVGRVVRGLSVLKALCINNSLC